MNRSRLAAVIGFAIAAAAVCVTAPAEPANGKKAPEFTLKTLDGDKATLKSLIGEGKDRKAALVLAFWGTWCPPCRAEAPHLQALYDKYRERGVAVVGIDLGDTPERVRSYVDRSGLKYPVLLDPDGTKAGEKYDAPPIPRTFVVDSEGIVRASFLGYASGSERELEDQVKAILKERKGE